MEDKKYLEKLLKHLKAEAAKIYAEELILQRKIEELQRKHRELCSQAKDTYYKIRGEL
jgi:phage shock protein A